jgi:LPXTG-motif cell wall-anchored protein
VRTSPRQTLLNIALVALLAAGCVVGGAGIADASPLPRSVPLIAVFDHLQVGDQASKSWPVEIPRPALITDTSIRREGAGDAFRWRASLCPESGGSCVDLLRTPVGTQLAAGSYRLALGVTVVASGSQQQSVEGHLTFVEHPTGSLALTGSSSLVPLLLSGVAAIAVGAFLYLAARRRRPADHSVDKS